MKKYEKEMDLSENIYVGIDVHKKHYLVSIRTFDLELFTGSIPSDPEKLIDLIDKYNNGKVKAVYEAGYSGYYLYDKLKEAGIDCIVTPPNMVPFQPNNRVKTDRLDAKKLAIYLSKNLLKKVWVPDKELRYHREILRRRKQIVGDRRRVQTRIRSFIDLYNIKFISNSYKWSAKFREDLGKIKLEDDFLQYNFDLLLKEYDMLDQLLKECTQTIKELSETERYKNNIKILRSITGVGLLTSMEILLELGDVSRFKNSKQIASYVGLTPSQYSSGEHIRMGHIAKSGKSNLRSLLVEASWMLIRKDNIMQEKYEKLKYRVGVKRAIVAIARKLLIIARIMLLNKVNYNYRYN